MGNEKKAARLRRPRISLKALLVLQTLLCAYLACWWPTQKYGLNDVRKFSDERFAYGAVASQAFHRSPTVIVPLIVQRLEFDPISNNSYRRVYLWFFGLVAKAPWCDELPCET